MNNPYSIFRRVFKPDPGQVFRSRNARCLFRVALTAILFGSLSGHSLADDLWDIYSLALTNDPVYQAATLSHSANALELPIARTAFKPSVTAEGSVRKIRRMKKIQTLETTMIIFSASTSICRCITSQTGSGSTKADVVWKFRSLSYDRQNRI